VTRSSEQVLQEDSNQWLSDANVESALLHQNSTPDKAKKGFIEQQVLRNNADAILEVFDHDHLKVIASKRTSRPADTRFIISDLKTWLSSTFGNSPPQLVLVMLPGEGPSSLLKKVIFQDFQTSAKLPTVN